MVSALPQLLLLAVLLLLCHSHARCHAQHDAPLQHVQLRTGRLHLSRDAQQQQRRWVGCRVPAPLNP